MLPLLNSTYFHDLLESFSYGVLIFNIEEEIYAVNTYACYLLESEAEDIVGRHWVEVLGKLERQDELGKFVTSSMQQDACPLPFTTRLTRSDGGVIHLSLQTSLLMENKKIFGVLVSINDVTSMVRLHEREKQILAENHRLEHERAESLHKLSMGVAHQIRNPVMTIGGFASLLKRSCDTDGKNAQYVEAIYESGERLQSIVNAVSDFTSATPRSRDSVDMLELVRSLKRFAEDTAAQLGASIIVSTDVGHCELQTDAGLLQKALELAAENAVQALFQSGRLLTISVRKEQNRCVIEISDDGPGISADDIPFVFDPFYTTSPTAVGMGLSIARRIMNELAGDVEITSHVRGTTATLWLEM